MFEGLLKPNETLSENGVDLSPQPNGGRGTTSSANQSGPNIFRDKVEKGDTGLSFDRVTYRFCCRADSPSATIPITGFPSDTGPFYLYKSVPYHSLFPQEALGFYSISIEIAIFGQNLI